MSTNPDASAEACASEAYVSGDSGMNVRSMVVRHVSWASIGTVLNLSFALLSTLIMARILLPTDFARFNVARTGLSFLGILATFGLGNAALVLLGHYLADNGPQRRRAVMAGISRIAVVTVTIGAIAAYIATMCFGEELTGGDAGLIVAVVFGLGTIACGILNIVSDSVRGAGAPGAANILGNVMQGSPAGHIGTLTVVAAMSMFGQASWQSAIFAYAAASGIAAGFGCIVLWRLLHRSADNENFDSSTGKSVPSAAEIFSMSWPLAVASLISFTSTSCDMFMTTAFPDPETMAYYVAARRVIVLLAIPMTVLNTAARGLISPLYAAKMSRQLEKALRNGAGLVAIPCTAAALLVMFYPEFVLWLVLGEGYGEASTILRILVPGQIILVISGSCAALLRLSGHQRVMLLIDGFTASAMLGLGPFIAAWYGAIGLAVLVSTMQILLNVITWAAAWKLTGINTWCSLRVLARFRTLLKRRGF